MILGLSTLVAAAAEKYDIEADVLFGLITVESGGVPEAIRFEPRYRYMWDVEAGKPFRRLKPNEIARAKAPAGFSAPRGVSADTEWAAQKTSWGLMQVMGAAARGKGFSGRFLTELVDPGTGIEWGCRALKAKMVAHRCDVAKALAAYNAGSVRIDKKTGLFVNQNYVDAVFEAAELFRKGDLL